MLFYNFAPKKKIIFPHLLSLRDGETLCKRPTESWLLQGWHQKFSDRSWNFRQVGLHGEMLFVYKFGQISSENNPKFSLRGVKCLQWGAVDSLALSWCHPWIACLLKEDFSFHFICFTFLWFRFLGWCWLDQIDFQENQEEFRRQIWSRFHWQVFVKLFNFHHLWTGTFPGIRKRRN